MKRLDFIANLLNNSEVVLDIGCDHGLVLKKAFDKKYIKKAFATDINEGPLLNAKKNLVGYNVEYYLSNGFLDLPELVFDTVVIAGMGAHLITEILTNANKDAKYILQANSKHEVLRSFLMNNGFIITDEHLVLDDFYYIIIEAKKGKMILSNEELYIGPVLKNKLESLEYYQHKIKQIESIYNNLDLHSKSKYQEIQMFYKNAVSVLKNNK
ncbi:class I SAM-dependent methyltransferase [Acholeplasma sp. OttesenSCG-928-E16]|nr:class I SAM-dependent methyltransferase [Acholeplasma sp. OttesenSCG-928-E16]